jgi:hypothetical protein
MLDLEVILDFACCSCGDPMGVTVKCVGKSVVAGKSEAASVKVPCPNCHGMNQIIFSPDDGTLHHVIAADKPRYIIPVPSYN